MHHTTEALPKGIAIRPIVDLFDAAFVNGHQPFVEDVPVFRPDILTETRVVEVAHSPRAM